jgi:hypothetical protein
MRLSTALAVLMFSVSLEAGSQIIELRGRILAEESRTPIPGANIRISAVQDTASVHHAITDTSGRFAISGLRAESQLLEVNHLAYSHQKKTVLLSPPYVDLGDILLRSRTIPIPEVLVRAMPPAVQKADTTEYVADAFKINRDALAEDLLLKLPGVSVVDGIVKAGGDEVKQVLVDGRPFFGADPLLALRNLPADAIEKVQVFEKMSDQAEFTGFDDGQSVRTINIVIRESRRNSMFGKAAAGYGEGGRYVASGDGNIFSGQQRISLLGQSNNVNQQGFSSQDMLGSLGSGPPQGGGPRGRRGGPPGGPGGTRGGPASDGMPRPGGAMELASTMIGLQNGTATVHALGGDYSDFWASGLNMSGSYFFNHSDNGNTQSLARDYGLTGAEGLQYNQSSGTTTRNSNHRFNLRLEVPIDSMNSLMFRPSVSFQNTDAGSDLLATSVYPGGLPSSVRSMGKSSGAGYSLAQNMLFRHRFDLPGRTLSIDAGISLTDMDKSSTLLSSVIAQSSLDSQTSDNTTRGTTLSARLAYTEPIAVNSQLQVELSSSLNKGSSDTRTFVTDTLLASADRMDTSLSNAYENSYWSHRAGVSYQLRTAELRFTTGASFDLSTLRGDRTFPSQLATGRTFGLFLPNVSMDYSPRIGSHLRIFYRASTRAPSISQLQDVVDNTNALQLTAGNPELEQTLTHSLVARLLETEGDRATSRMFLLSILTTRDYIANAIRTITRDTVLAGGVQAYSGAQITTPTNLQGYWSARASADFGMPLELISSNANLSTNASLTRYPGEVDDTEYYTTSWSVGGGFSLGTNVSRDIDGHLSYNVTYTNSKNSLYPEVRTSYFSHSASLRSTLTFWEFLVIRNQGSYILRTGLSDAKNQTSLLWTATLGVKFLRENRGELRLTMYDILNENRNISRTVTESYIEDTTNEVVPRYLLLTFEYRWL